MTEEKAVTMKPTEIDNDGVWHWGDKEIPLLGNHMPIPDNVRLDMDPVRQEVLAIVDVSDWMTECPGCGTEAKGIILMTEFTKVYPAHCCDRMIWMTDERDYSEIYEA